MITLTLIGGMIFGFVLFTLLSGEKEGRIGTFILILKTKHHKYHLHHWALSLLIILILFLFGYYNDLVYGFLIGSTLQGIRYKDWHKFLIKQKRKKKKK